MGRAHGMRINRTLSIFPSLYSFDTIISFPSHRDFFFQSQVVKSEAADRVALARSRPKNNDLPNAGRGRTAAGDPDEIDCFGYFFCLFNDETEASSERLAVE